MPPDSIATVAICIIFKRLVLAIPKNVQLATPSASFSVALAQFREIRPPQDLTAYASTARDAVGLSANPRPLGHGVTPDVDPENVQLMIHTVRSCA